MNKKAVMITLVVLGFFLGVLPFIKHSYITGSLESNVNIVMVEYGDVTKAMFEKRLKGLCEESQLDMSTVKIFVEETKRKKLLVDITYSRTFRVLLVPVTKNIHIHLEQNILEY